MAIAGSLGMLPLWVTTEIEVHKGRPMKWLLAIFFEDVKERNKVKADDMISNIMAALKTRYAGDFLRRSVENIVCKVYRRHTKTQSDGLFYDILLPHQNLYSVYMNQVRIMSANGSSTCKTKTPLLNTVPFGGQYLTLKEVCAQIPSDWSEWEPTVKGLGRPFLDALVDTRRGERPDFSFDLNVHSKKNAWLSIELRSTETRLYS
jgi:hypothetical protein